MKNIFKNKIGFSVLASAVLMNLLKKQRDAVGLSVYSDTYEYYSPEKVVIDTIECYSTN